VEGKFMHVRRALCLSLGFVFAGGLAAADDPFVGKWKLNTAKSKFTGQLQVIQDLGGNKYKFTSGAESWNVWVDGGDQPSPRDGDLVSWKTTAPNTWLVVHKMDGKITRSAILKISADETTMTRTTKGTRPDGSAYTMDFRAKRVSGAKGLPGTWEITTLKMDADAEWSIEPYEGDGLSFVFPSEKERQDMKFDGKEYPDRGPTVPAGSTSSAKRVNARTIEWTDKLKDEVTDHEELKVSADGKTLTVVTKQPGAKTPQIGVYDRQ
jgi:hypothetical protein